MRYIVTYRNEMTMKIVALVVSLDCEGCLQDVLTESHNMLRSIAHDSTILYSLQTVEAI